ncbi:MAG: DnaJ domain-containing protein [Desulforegulaceae bacterium]|nr:DnaJ domain-containing protein [Desulforegulaceae bacterium]
MKIFLIIFGLVYFLFPFDLIRDFIPYIGYLDDLAVIVWIIYIINKKKKLNGFRSSYYNKEQSGPGAFGKKGIKNCYEILGMTESSSNEEIKKAYKELVSKYHPDKVEHLGEEFKRFAHEKFIEIKSAYEEIKKLRGL